jgi:hypothetical protein
MSALGCVKAAAKTDDPKHREMLIKLAARVDEESGRIASIDAIEASVNLQNLFLDEWAVSTHEPISSSCDARILSSFL